MQLLHGFSSLHWRRSARADPRRISRLTLTLRRLQVLQPARDLRCARMDFLAEGADAGSIFVEALCQGEVGFSDSNAKNTRTPETPLLQIAAPHSA